MDSFLQDPEKPRHQSHSFSSSKTVYCSEYDSLLRLLLVMFHNGSRYQYFAVEQTTYDEFVSAPSPGRYVSVVLKTYKTRKLTG